MVIKVSCGGCHVGGLGYKISVNEIGAYSAGLGGGGLGLNRGFTSLQLLTVCCQ